MKNQTQDCTSRFPSTRLTPLALVALCLLAIRPAAQAQFTWNSGGGDNNWSTGANWGGTAPGSPQAILNFGSGARLSPYNDFAAGSAGHQIFFTTGSSSFTLGGNSITFYDWGGIGPKIENASSSLQTIGFPIVGGYASGLEINPVSGDLTLTGTLDNGGYDVNVYGPNSKMLTLSGAASGSGKLIIKQFSKVKYSAASGGWTGNTEIDSGEFWLGSGGGFANSSTIYLGNGGQVANTAKLWIESGGGSLGNPIVINPGNSGTRVVGGLNSSGSVTYTGNLTLNGPLNLVANAAGGTSAFTSGVISGSSALNINNGVTAASAGTVNLAGANTYDGATSVDAGILRVSHATGLGSTAAGTTVNGTTLGTVGTILELNGVNVSSGESLTLATGVSGNRSTLRSLQDTVNTWAGGVVISGAGLPQLAVGATGFPNGQLNVSGSITASSFTGTGMYIRGNGSGTLSGLVNLGAGVGLSLYDGSTWTISNGSGNIWGGTAINYGTLVLGANSALPVSTTVQFGSADGSGTLKLNGFSQTVAGLAVSAGSANKVVNGSGTLGTLTVSTTGTPAFGGVLGGPGANENNFALVKSGAGTLTLSGGNTYSGGTIVSVGKLQIGSSGTAGTLGSGAVSVASGATLAFERTDAQTIANTISGAGTISLGSASGTVSQQLTFSDLGGFTGALSLTKGTVRVVNNNGLGTSAGMTTLQGSANRGTILLDGTSGDLTIAEPIQLGQLKSTDTATAGAFPIYGGLVNFAGNNTVSGEINELSGGTFSLIQSSNGVLTLSGTLRPAVSSGRVFRLGGPANGVVSGLVQERVGWVSGDTSGIEKAGTGEWSLSNPANSFLGPVTVTDGTLTVSKIANGGSASCIGQSPNTAGNLVLQGGTLKYTGSGDSTDRLLRINPRGGTLDASGTGPLVFSNVGTHSTYPGNTSLSVGFASGSTTIGYTSAGALGIGMTVVSGPAGIPVGAAITALDADQGLITLNQATTAASVETAAVFTGGANLDRTLTLTGNYTGNNEIKGILANASGTGKLLLTKTGTGKWILSGVNTYTGTTTVSGGTLAYGVANALATGAVTVNGADAVLSLGGFSDTVGTVTLNGGGQITGSSGVLTTTGTFEMMNGSVSAILGGAVALNKTTSGTVTLSGVNTYTGTTTVSAGTLAYGVNNAIASGAVTVNGADAVLSLGGFSDTVGTVTLNGGGQITGSGGVLTTTGTFEMMNGSASAILDGAVALNKTTSGTVTLSGVNTFTGNITISGTATANNLRIASSTALGPSGMAKTVTLTGANRVASTLELSNNITVDINKVINTSGKAYLSVADSAFGTPVFLRNVSGNNAWLGNIIINNGGGAYSIESLAGTLTLGDVGTASVLRNDVAGGTRTFDFRGAGDVVVNSKLTPNGTGLTGVNKYGTGTLTLGRTDNDFASTPLLAVGTTVIANLANNGTVSSLGSGTQINFGGTLRHVGSANSTSGRALALYGLSQTLDSSGAGTLTLNSVSTANYSTASSTTAAPFSSGATTITVADVFNVLPGTTIAGRGIATGTKVTAVDYDNRQLTLDTPTTTTTLGGLTATTTTLATGGQNKIRISTANASLPNLFIGMGVSGTNSIPSSAVISAIDTGTGDITLDQNLTADVWLGLAISFNSGGMTFGSASAIDRTFTLRGSNTGDNTFGLLIVDPGTGKTSLNKMDDGKWILGRANTYTGTTTVSGGTLAYGVASALFSGAVTVNGATAVLSLGGYSDTVGTVTLNGGGQITGSGGVLTTTGTFEMMNGTVSAILGGAVALNKTTSGTVTLSGANTFSGNTRIGAGTLTLGHASALQNSTLDMNVNDAGALSFGSLTAATLGGLTGSRNLSLQNASSAAVATTIGNNNSSTTYSGQLDGAGSLIKAGTGTLTLSGANSFTGEIAISGAGTLQYDHASGLGSGANKLGFAAANATLKPNATASVARPIEVGATGCQINPQTGVTSTFTGGFTEKSGWTPGGSDVFKFESLGTTVLATTPLTLPSLQINKGQSGTLELNVAGNTYRRLWNYNGTLKTGVAGALDPNAEFDNRTSGSVLDLNGYSQGVGRLVGSASSGAGSTITSATAAALTINPSSSAYTYAGVIGGAVSVVKAGAGTQTLSAANTYSGVTTVSAGTLSLGTSGSLSNTPSITVAANAVLDVTNLTAGVFTLQPNQALKGNGTVSGNTIVSGTIAAGSSIGTLTNSGNLTWAPGGTNQVEIGTATGTPGLDWDHLSITGDLVISPTNQPVDSQKFTIALVSIPGGVTGFVNTASYAWPIATVGGTVYGFNAAKFLLNTNAFTNDLGGGALSVLLSNQSVVVAFTPATISCDHTTTNWSAPVGNTMVMTFSNLSTLVSVQALTLSNCTLQGTAYSSSGAVLSPNPITPITLTARTNLPDGTVKLVLTATKITPGVNNAAVNALVIDKCGRGKSFDPVITTLTVTSGNQVQQRFEGLMSAEHYLQVVNGTPGLKWLEVNLNGRVFRLDPLTDGQEVSADLFAAMHEGDNNVVILTGAGDIGASALVMITDTPTGNLVVLPEVVTLTLNQTTDGLVLSWPDTLTGWELQSSGSADAGWAAFVATPVSVNGQFTVTVPASDGAQFYRLTGPAAVAASKASASQGAVMTGITASNPSNTSTIQRTYDGILW